jgi:hypothetical protein
MSILPLLLVIKPSVMCPKKKSPSGGWGLGLLIFETKLIP